ncbi:MAG: lipocalin-like domain-containing protein [Acidobacteriota bacterium]
MQRTSRQAILGRGIWPLLGLLAAALLHAGCGSSDAAVEAGTFSSPVAALVSDGPQEGYSLATEARPFVFPEDHGPHPDFQTEWWYFTGHLETDEGRRFGIQWTIFRRALIADMPERASDWASRQLYMGHVALTDIEGERHLAAERYARGGADLAGAEIRPIKVWLEDWEAVSRDPEDLWPLELRARESTDRGSFGMDLVLEPRKPHVLQGDRGLSQKHEDGASFYYSFTRLDAQGTIDLDGETYRVTGSSWLDREWSTSTLASDQTGWDWFSLQLDDGRDLMFYLLRLDDGSPHPMSAGVLVDTEGGVTRLALEDVDLEVLETWRSPRSGGVYPARWTLTVPDSGLSLQIDPVIPDQELDIQFRYWEGAVDVRGESSGQDIAGQGYVELVGYADAA